MIGKHDIERGGMDRRTFLQGAVAAGALGAVGSLAGCATTTDGTDAAAAATGDVVLTQEIAAGTWSFEVPPAPIADSEITNTVEADIIVVGAGTSGLVCANAAAEGGAKVVVIAKSSTPVGRGGSNHAVNTRLTKELGLSYDIGKVFKAEMANHTFRIDQDKWSLFINNSGQAMDWLMDKMEAAGYTSVIEKGFQDPDGILTMHPGSHSWISAEVTAAGGGQQLVADALAATALASGVEIFYDTTAAQLVREGGTGRVTAVIASGTDGAYTKYVGAKGVVLATGDFTQDTEMLAKYCPEALDVRGWGGAPNSGDGHKMAIWVGAAWQKNKAAAPMIMGPMGLAPQPYGGFPGLLVNMNAERYGNEDTITPYAGAQMIRQPEQKVFAVWTANFAQAIGTWLPFGVYYGDDFTGTPVADVIAGWDTAAASEPGGGPFAVQNVKSDTLDDLASQLGIDAAALKATVAEYNGYCAAGVDARFHKRPELLVPIDETGPFYGSALLPTLLCVTGGILTNTNLQVLDENEAVIEGLYAVGTLAGDMFSGCYTFLIPGHNLGGNCVTFGYLTGQKLAAGTI